MTCTLRASARDAMIVHALAERPRECCGVLVGSVCEIREALPVANRSERPDRFLLDPAGHIEVRREARQRGLEVLGFYHSHPRSPAAPSKRDRDEASYPGHLYLIVSLAGDPVDLRGYQFDEGTFVEVPLVTVP